MAGKTANAFVKINVIVSGKKASRELDGMAGTLNRWASGFRKAGLVATTAFAAVTAAVVLATKMVMRFVNAYVEWGKQNLAVTRLTGIAGKKVAELNTQLRMSGVDATKAQTGLGLFAKNLDKARQGMEKAARPLQYLDKTSKTYGESLSKIQTAIKDASGPFGRLGISLKDQNGKLKDAGTILEEVRNKLSKIDDAATRAGIASAIFGKGYKEMLPWLMKSKREIEDFNKILEESGVEWGGKQVRSMKQYIKAQREVSLRWDLFKIFLGQQLMPIVTKVFRAMNKWLSDPENIKKVQDALKGVADTVADLVGWFLKLSDNWKKFIGAVVVAGAASGPLMLTLSSILSVAGKVVGAFTGAGKAASAAKSASGLSKAGQRDAALINAGAAAQLAPMAGAGLGGAATAFATTFAAAAGPLLAGAIAASIVNSKATIGPQAGQMQRSGVSNMGRMAGSAAGTAAQNAAKAADALTKSLANLYRAAATASGKGFGPLFKAIKAAEDGLVTFDLDTKKPLSSLQSMQARLMDVGLSAKDAFKVLTKQFGKDVTGPFRRTLLGLPPVMNHVKTKVTAAHAQMAAKLMKKIRMPGPDASALLSVIQSVINKMQQLGYTAQQAQDAVNRALGARARLKSGSMGAGGRPVTAEGGVFYGAQTRIIAEAGPEAVIPLTKPARAAQVMAEAGLSPQMAVAGGGSITVPIYLDGKQIAEYTLDLMGRRAAQRARRR